MDSGIGILPKDRDSIFESFRQVKHIFSTMVFSY